MTSLPGSPPPWFDRLPAFRPQPERRVVIVDNQALSYYLLDGRRDPPELTFLFEDHRIVAQISRQVIDETLHSTGTVDSGMDTDRRGRPRRVGPVITGPGLPVALQEKMWLDLASLQARGQVVLSGLTQMTPGQRAQYAELAAVIEQVSGRGMGGKDARVAADALVKRIPIFTLDARFRDTFGRVLNEEPLRACLAKYDLSAFAPGLFVG